MIITGKESPSATIIMPVFNATEALTLTLQHLYKYTNLKNNNLIIVDNCSNSKTKSLIKHWAQKVDLFVISFSSNLGPAGAKLAAFPLVQTEFVVTLDSDVIVSPNWLEKLLNYLKGNKKVGLVAPYTTNQEVIVPQKNIPVRRLWNETKNKNLQASFKRFLCGKSWEQFLNALYRANKLPLLEITSPIGFVSTCCLAGRTEYIQKAGGISTLEFGLYGPEDIDLSFRMAKSGFKIVRLNQLFVHHFEHTSLRENNLDPEVISRPGSIVFVKKWQDDMFNWLQTEIKRGKDLEKIHRESWLLQRIVEEVPKEKTPGKLRSILKPLYS